MKQAKKTGLFHWLFSIKIENVDALQTKLEVLEEKINLLEEKLKEKVEKDGTVTKTEQDAVPSVHIEHLRVDKIIIEKIDYTNNLGQLGIKELTGKLNIGTSYEGGPFKEKKSEKFKKLKDKQAKVNIRAKTEQRQQNSNKNA